MHRGKGISGKAMRVGGRGVGRRGLTGKHTAKQPRGFGYSRGKRR